METAVLITLFLVFGGGFGWACIVEVRKRPRRVGLCVALGAAALIAILLGIALLFNP